MGKADSVTILVVGDVIGQPGCRALFTLLPGAIKATGASFVIVNGENAAEGFGLFPEQLGQFFQAGANVITSGNHIWHRDELYRSLDDEQRLLRPHNYPKGNPGHGYGVYESRGLKVAVINLQGRYRMQPIDCPFKAAREALRSVSKETRLILIDFHAEQTEEKEALGLYLDGEVTALFGTHTHVPTADERILPKGTAYITDLGATGPIESVIGFDPSISVERALTQMPLRNEVAEGVAALNGVVITAEAHSGRATAIERYRVDSPV
ncbi:MAG: TIGR00282 family metallophosphoesterase [Alkalispirochaetaceae bacterium]